MIARQRSLRTFDKKVQTCDRNSVLREYWSSREVKCLIGHLVPCSSMAVIVYQCSLGWVGDHILKQRKQLLLGYGCLDKFNAMTFLFSHICKKCLLPNLLWNGLATKFNLCRNSICSVLREYWSCRKRQSFLLATYVRECSFGLGWGPDFKTTESPLPLVFESSLAKFEPP